MDHLPGIQAGEQSAEATMIALGTGALSQSDASEVRRKLAQAANGGAARRPSQRQKTPDELAAMGIQVVMVEPSRG